MPEFEFNSYHVLFLALGASIVNSYWLPRFITGWEPAASSLLLISGAIAFAFIPAMPRPLNPLDFPEFWELASEFAVIVALFGTGLRIDSEVTLTRLTPTIRLLLIAMPLTIFAIAVPGYAWAGLSLGAAVALGAVLAPTDPVLAGDLQVGPPQEGDEQPVRYTLTTEAGLNDGLAFPFLYLGLIIAVQGFAPGSWGMEWVARDVVYRIAVGVAGGVVTGWVLGKIVFAIPRGNALADSGTGVIALAGVLLCYGATELVEGYGFIAAFCCGLALRRAEPQHDYHQKLHTFSEAVEHAVTALILFLLGGALPMLLPELTWPLVLLSLGLIFLIRPLGGWISLIGTDIAGRDRFLAAFYGVRGIGSIYYVGYAMSHHEFKEAAQLWAVVGLTILLSTFVHGFTSGLAVRRLGSGR